MGLYDHYFEDVHKERKEKKLKKMYSRAIDKKEKEEKEPIGGWIGQVGQKMTLNVQVLTKKSVGENKYTGRETTLLKLVDTSTGFDLINFSDTASPITNVLKQQRYYKIDIHIRKHDIYSGVKQTHVILLNAQPA